MSTSPLNGAPRNYSVNERFQVETIRVSHEELSKLTRIRKFLKLKLSLNSFKRPLLYHSQVVFRGGQALDN